MEFQGKTQKCMGKTECKRWTTSGDMKGRKQEVNNDTTSRTQEVNYATLGFPQHSGNWYSFQQLSLSLSKKKGFHNTFPRVLYPFCVEVQNCMELRSEQSTLLLLQHSGRARVQVRSTCSAGPEGHGGLRLRLGLQAMRYALRGGGAIGEAQKGPRRSMPRGNTCNAGVSGQSTIQVRMELRVRCTRPRCTRNFKGLSF